MKQIGKNDVVPATLVGVDYVTVLEKEKEEEEEKKERFNNDDDNNNSNFNVVAA